MADVLIPMGSPLKLKLGSYVGSGTYGLNNPTQIDFGITPIIWGVITCQYTDGGTEYLKQYDNHIVGKPTGNVDIDTGFSGRVQVTMSWSGNTVNFYHRDGATHQSNSSGHIYTWFAFY